LREVAAAVLGGRFRFMQGVGYMDLNAPLIVPDAEPFLLRGGPIGCLLVHGFSSSPEEMRWLGDDLARRGHTVLGIRLAGHGTFPGDLARTRWQDWMVSIEEGLAILGGMSELSFVIGLSLGGMATLLAAAHYPMTGAVAMSTAFLRFPRRMVLAMRLLRWLRPVVRKGVEAHPVFGKRREADYPAYSQYPTRILLEVDKLQESMRTSLASVNIPVLLIHSRKDAWVPVENAQLVHDHLGTEDKELQLLEGFDHAIVRDPQRLEAFEVVAGFVERVAAAS
jgi:carboxylesterase